jgi:hypothetical protein
VDSTFVSSNTESVSIVTTSHLKMGVQPTPETSCITYSIFLRQWTVSNIVFLCDASVIVTDL